MRSPLTETINRVQGMITYVRENLSTDEYMLFLDLLVPEPEAIKTPVKKKKRKPRSSSKSPRASNLAETLKERREAQRQMTTSDNDDDSAPAPICDTCGNISGYVDHFQPSPSYHPFTVKGVAQAASAGD